MYPSAGGKDNNSSMLHVAAAQLVVVKMNLQKSLLYVNIKCNTMFVNVRSHRM